MVRDVCYVVLCDMSHHILRVFMLGMLRLPCIISLYTYAISRIIYEMILGYVIEDAYNGNRRCLLLLNLIYYYLL